VIEIDLRDLQESVEGVVARIDSVVGDDACWTELADLIAELEALIARQVMVGHSRWIELKRHLGFGEPVDWEDIVGSDWPSIRRFLTTPPASDEPSGVTQS
jgi:hypothetical protein